MVHFEKDKIVIEIPATFPAEDWGEIMKDMLSLLQCEREDSGQTHYHVLYLMTNMMPEWEQAKRMIPSEKPDNQ